MSIKAAALSIHELAGADREAVLRVLSPEERARIMPLLEQLQDLGIPAGMVNRLPPDEPPIPSIDSDMLQSHRRCAALSAETVMQCTREQSAQTLGALLAVRAWPWAQELLRQLPEPRRRAVQEFCQTDSSIRPAVQAVLVETLAAAAERSGRPVKERVGLFRRLAPWMR